MVIMNNLHPKHPQSIKVLFVCLGNICRSPTAHALFQAKVNNAELNSFIEVDSAGTADWHTGLPPDTRSQQIALTHGYDMSQLSARAVTVQDFHDFDYILGMDNSNLQHLNAMKPDDYSGVLGLFLEEAGVTERQEVPDPYYGDNTHFEYAIDLVNQGAEGLLARIRRERGL